MKQPVSQVGHTLTPLRRLEAIAPSGASAWAMKLTDREHELADGLEVRSATADEIRTWWQATRKLERSGLAMWSAGVALLRREGWMVTTDE